MRYVKKETPPAFLTDWVQQQIDGGIVPDYEDFRERKKLNEVLRGEQRAICCYCQQRISHYQKPHKEGSHNEHLVPQKGENGDPKLQLEYSNIFACCNYSEGLKKRLMHCGQAKGDILIPGIVQRGNCSEYFKYNTLGEILPNGEFETIGEYAANENLLTKEQKEALKVISVLNLNCESLVIERKNTQTRLFQVLPTIDKERIAQKVEQMDSQVELEIFADMLLYYMRQKN